MEAFTEAIITQITALLDQRIGTLEKSIDERIGILEKSIDKRIGAIDNKLERLMCLHANSQLGRAEPIRLVPNKEGQLPDGTITVDIKPKLRSTINSAEASDEKPGYVKMPVTIPPTVESLLVAGNERLAVEQPEGGRGRIANTWNKDKSQALLKFYGEVDEESEDENDPENDYTVTSRSRRIRVARALGITQTQLNLCQLSL
ncbi:hypothetical protein CAOG_03798 [Capsaspora owczarzaki ATCC 30864]|uniref:Uncharacterized protein n=1 Tax=Capsaspora owczarzaki (strain ATCC 30864) TaxID=595528 RepID=A0A0D2UCX5_CAPO3|nr:hypothetical protein CAOG_03798 [Capsaspora owczarzaki ATCC 30864]KJE92916.1 hypothetical protein CAOG_003798 [Capsaspora owczarzaki ATCC 30864]|eukprot:XP_004363526.1 hypothetical protein CAOG_03798 [Capsaspora owczarzaki ATCC 30864]